MEYDKEKMEKANNLVKILEKKEIPIEITNFKEETIKELNNFYNYNINPDFKIILLDKREEFDIISGEKTESWMIGRTINVIGKIIIFNIDAIERETNHKKEDFYKTLKHEIAHLYFFKISSKGHPKWLNEGMAYFLAKQDYKDLPLEQAVKAIDQFNSFDGKHYPHSAKLVRLLIEKYGKEKIIELINSWYYKRDEFENNFKEIYGFKFTKEELIKNL